MDRFLNGKRVLITGVGGDDAHGSTVDLGKTSAAHVFAASRPVSPRPFVDGLASLGQPVLAGAPA